MAAARLLPWLAEEVKKRGRVKLGELATMIGVSYQYFKYSIVKQLLASHDDIVLVKEGHIEYLEYRPKARENVK